MRQISLFLTLALGLLGCSKDVVVDKNGAAIILRDAEFEITNLAEGTWKVGRLYRDTVSKNLTPVVGLPSIDSDDVAFLNESVQVDAWLIKIIQHNSQGARIELTTLYAPFRAVQKNRASSNLAVRSVSFSLTYAASAISERFRRFQCPAFSHDRRLDDYDISGDNAPLEFVVRAGQSFNEKIVMNELVPTSLNIGNTMVGEYSMEVALFSTAKKQLYSDFKRLPIVLRVRSEKTVSIDGCAGIHEEFTAPKPQTVPGRK